MQALYHCKVEKSKTESVSFIKVSIHYQ